MSIHEGGVSRPMPWALKATSTNPGLNAVNKKGSLLTETPLHQCQDDLTAAVHRSQRKEPAEKTDATGFRHDLEFPAEFTAVTKKSRFIRDLESCGIGPRRGAAVRPEPWGPRRESIAIAKVVFVSGINEDGVPGGISNIQSRSPRHQLEMRVRPCNAGGISAGGGVEQIVFRFVGDSIGVVSSQVADRGNREMTQFTDHRVSDGG